MVEVRATFARSPPATYDTSTWPQLPDWKQKLVDTAKFDPQGLLGIGGSHTPLLGFLGGQRTHRTPEALVRREERARERKGGKDREAKGRGKGARGKGKGSASSSAGAERGSGPPVLTLATPAPPYHQMSWDSSDAREPATQGEGAGTRPVTINYVWAPATHWWAPWQPWQPWDDAT